MVRREPSVIRVSAALATVALAAACGDGSTGPAPPVAIPNRAPAAVGRIPGLTLTALDTARVEVSSYFTDADGDALTYAAASSDAVATVTVSGSTVTLTRAAFPAAVTVTASDPGGLSASQSFEVTVTVLYPIHVRYTSRADAFLSAGELPGLREAVSRGTLKWARVLWPTPVAPFPGTASCWGGDTISDMQPGLTLLVDIVDEPDDAGGFGRSFARGGECWGDSRRYNPETGTIPAGKVRFNVAGFNYAEALNPHLWTEERWNLSLELIMAHEIGHVVGIGTSDEWEDNLERVAANDSVALGRFEDRCYLDPEVKGEYTWGGCAAWFYRGVASMRAVSEVFAPGHAYTGKLIPLNCSRIGFGADGCVYDPHWNPCLLFAWGENMDVMMSGGGLRHNNSSGRFVPIWGLTAVTLNAMRGFLYDPAYVDWPTPKLTRYVHGDDKKLRTDVCPNPAPLENGARMPVIEYRAAGATSSLGPVPVVDFFDGWRTGVAK